MGILQDDVSPTPEWRFDRASKFHMRPPRPTISCQSPPELEVRTSRNLVFTSLATCVWFGIDVVKFL